MAAQYYRKGADAGDCVATMNLGGPLPPLWRPAASHPEHPLVATRTRVTGTSNEERDTNKFRSFSENWKRWLLPSRRLSKKEGVVEWVTREPLLSTENWAIPRWDRPPWNRAVQVRKVPNCDSGCPGAHLQLQESPP